MHLTTKLKPSLLHPSFSYHSHLPLVYSYYQHHPLPVIGATDHHSEDEESRYEDAQQDNHNRENRAFSDEESSVSEGEQEVSIKKKKGKIRAPIQPFSEAAAESFFCSSYQETQETAQGFGSRRFGNRTHRKTAWRSLHTKTEATSRAQPPSFQNATHHTQTQTKRWGFHQHGRFHCH